MVQTKWGMRYAANRIIPNKHSGNAICVVLAIQQPNLKASKKQDKSTATTDSVHGGFGQRRFTKADAGWA